MAVCAVRATSTHRNRSECALQILRVSLLVYHCLDLTGSQLLQQMLPSFHYLSRFVDSQTLDCCLKPQSCYTKKHQGKAEENGPYYICSVEG